MLRLPAAIANHMVTWLYRNNQFQTQFFNLNFKFKWQTTSLLQVQLEVVVRVSLHHLPSIYPTVFCPSLYFVVLFFASCHDQLLVISIHRVSSRLVYFVFLFIFWHTQLDVDFQVLSSSRNDIVTTSSCLYLIQQRIIACIWYHHPTSCLCLHCCLLAFRRSLGFLSCLFFLCILNGYVRLI